MAADESFQQECIPVGCVPSAAVAVSAPGGRGVSSPAGGVWSGVVGVLLLGGVSASRRCLLPGGVCSRGGGLLPGGHLLRGGGVSQHAPRQTLPVNRMTDRCKNITFANFVCGR